MWNYTLDQDTPVHYLYRTFTAHSVATVDLIESLWIITLSFDSDQIYASKTDGPYKLTNLILVDNSDAALVVEEATDVFTTVDYPYERFGPGLDITW